MPLVVEPIPVGFRLVDTIAIITPAQALTLRAVGVEGVIRYHETLTESECAGLFAAGLGLSVVGYSRPKGWRATAAMGTADAAAELTALSTLELPRAGLVGWCDLEGCASNATDVGAYCDAFGTECQRGGAIGGLYVGADQPLSGQSLFRISRITRYWRSMSQVPEPDCGWCMVQLYPSTEIAGIPVDIDFACQDFSGRSSSWIVSRP